MGTRSLTFIHDGAAVKPFFNMYRQYDGYPSGHGKELFDFLKDIKIVNGIPGGEQTQRLANGPCCLAAQLVSHFKDGAGNIYICPVSSVDCGQEYQYHVHADTNGVTVRVFSVDARNRKNLMFNGTVEAFGEFCNGSDE